MGRKVSWFSAIKRVFVPSSKEKSSDGQDKKTTNQKKKSRGVLRAGESEAFVPLFREPSSIEKILDEVDDEIIVGHPVSSTPSLPRVASPKVSSPRTNAPPKAYSPWIIHNRKKVYFRPEPTSTDLQISATKIQAAYRGYIVRRSFRALRGLVRLQGVVRGQSVKRQTVNAMKQAQLSVWVQAQIYSRRTQMLENQALQRQAYQSDVEIESTLRKWTCNQLVDGNNEELDGLVLSQEAREERLRKRVEAVIKKQRATSYAYSRQLWKHQKKSAQTALGRFLHTEQGHRNHEQLITSRSSKSSMPLKGELLLQTSIRTPLSNSSSLNKYPRPRTIAANSRFDVAMRDDDSLTSCHSFSVPNYMQPTISAKAKVRANSVPKDGVFQNILYN